jgi:hypothetical protein
MLAGHPEAAGGAKPRARQLLPAAAVGAVIAVAAAAILLQRSTDRRPPEGLPLEDTIHRAEQVPTPQPVELNLTERANSVPSQAIQVEPAAAAATIPTAPISGRLKIIARPWAEVWVDGRRVGPTPFGSLELPPGEHQLRFMNEPYPEQIRRIWVQSGAEDTVLVDLQREAVSLTVTVDPWGYFWLDGDSIGLLPRAGPLYVGAGPHLLEVHHPQYRGWQDSASFAPGDSLVLRLDLKSGTMIASKLNRNHE